MNYEPPDVTPQTKRHAVRDFDVKSGKNYRYFPILYQSNDINRCWEYIMMKGLI